MSKKKAEKEINQFKKECNFSVVPFLNLRLLTNFFFPLLFVFLRDLAFI